MRVVALDEKQHEYLMHVFTTYTQSGIPPKELPIAADTFIRLTNARDLPAEAMHLGKAKIASMSPEGLAIEVPLGSEDLEGPEFS